MRVKAGLRENTQRDDEYTQSDDEEYILKQPRAHTHTHTREMRSVDTATDPT
jgi:hypothetical protein